MAEKPHLRGRLYIIPNHLGALLAISNVKALIKIVNVKLTDEQL